MQIRVREAPMSNEILDSLLKEYEQKKLKAELDAEKRKQVLYQKIPKLQQIEDELNAFAINTAKNILMKDASSLQNLEKKINDLKKQKEQLLQKSNLPTNYLQPFYECSICKDTGYISDQNYQTFMCNCLKQKIIDASFDKSNIANLEKENFSSFNENLFSDKIDKKKYPFDYSPRENIKNIKEKCISFVQDFNKPDTKNLLFTGNTGLR